MGQEAAADALVGPLKMPAKAPHRSTLSIADLLWVVSIQAIRPILRVLILRAMERRLPGLIPPDNEGHHKSAVTARICPPRWWYAPPGSSILLRDQRDSAENAGIHPNLRPSPPHPHAPPPRNTTISICAITTFDLTPLIRHSEPAFRVIFEDMNVTVIARQDALGKI